LIRDLAPAIGVHRHSDYRRHRDNSPAFALLQIGRVQPQIRPLAAKRTVEERMNPFVDVLAQLGDLRLADPRQTHRLNQLIHPSRRNPPIQASWITPVSAFSEIFRASRKGGK
jgi:hypothetical protein